MKLVSRGAALVAATIAVGVAVQRSASPQQTQDPQPVVTVYKSPT